MQHRILEVMCWAPGVLQTSVTNRSSITLGGREVWPYLPFPVGQFGTTVSLEPLETEDENWLSDPTEVNQRGEIERNLVLPCSYCLGGVEVVGWWWWTARA